MRLRLAPWLPLLGFLAGATIGWPRLPDALGDAPPDRFSADRAMAHVRAWAAEPRPSGSAHHAEVLDGVEAALSGAGLTVTRHPFAEGRVSGVNLVATAPGADDRDGVWLVAHSDSVPGSPGAADDGFGLAVVVESARALAARGAPEALKVLITDAEERGLYGARAEAARVPGARRVMLNVEARGASGPVYMFQTAGPGEPILAAWVRSGCSAQATSLARTVYDLLPNDTDFTVFRRAGWAGYDFALVHDAWRYHSPDDVPEGLDPRTVQQAGDCVTGLARAWTASGLGAVGQTGDDHTPAYAQVAGPTVVLPPTLVRGLGLAVVALALWPGGPRRTGGRLLGALAWLVAAGLAAAGGTGLLAAFARLRPDFWERAAEAPGAEGRYAAIAGIGVVLPIGVLALARRFGPAERGWHGVGIALAAAAVLLVPAAGYVLLPGACASVLTLRGRPRAAAAAAAFVAGLLLTPVLYAIYPALTSRAAPVLAVLPLLLLGWLAPQSFERKNVGMS